MKNNVNSASKSIILAILISLTSVSTQAGNILIKKDFAEKLAEGKSSFEVTKHNASVTSTEKSQIYGVCKFDCIFSGFDGYITDLKINGKMLQSGRIKVTRSTTEVVTLGRITVYLAPRTIVLALTPEQVKIIEQP